MGETAGDARPALELSGVSKVYGGEAQGRRGRAEGEGVVKALDGVTVTVARGEMVALMGPSGCGKSTLLHVAGLIDRPDAGRVVVDGQDASSLGDDARTLLRRRSIGFVSQFFNLLPTLTVRENVALPVVLAGMGGVAARDAALEVLDTMGLRYYGERYPHQLSGGQMQRVAIARAMIHSPAMLLADEPTGSLDSATGEAILEVFRRLNAEHGQTILIATHSGHAAEICGRLIRLHDGAVTTDERQEPAAGQAAGAPPPP